MAPGRQTFGTLELGAADLGVAIAETLEETLTLHKTRHLLDRGSRDLAMLPATAIIPGPETGNTVPARL